MRRLMAVALMLALLAGSGLVLAAEPVGEQQAMVIVHGIGEQKEGDFREFKKAIQSQFNAEVQRRTGSTPPENAVVVETALWQPITQRKQDRYLAEVAKKYGGELPTFNKMLVSLGGDALAYTRNRTQGIKMQNVLKEKVIGIAKEAGSKSVGLHVVAHSLGTLVSSDAMRKLTYPEVYQRRRPRGEGRELDQATLPENVDWAHFVTLGGPLVLGRDEADVKTPLKPRRWTNIIYPRDGVGTDLLSFGGKPLAGFEEFAAVTEEKHLKSASHRSFLRRITHKLVSKLPWVGAASHVFYWTDPRVQKTIAHQMADRYVKSLRVRPRAPVRAPVKGRR